MKCHFHLTGILKEKFEKKKINKSVSTPLCLRQNIFSPDTPEIIMYIREFCFNFHACETYLINSGLFKKETQNVIVHK